MRNVHEVRFVVIELLVPKFLATAVLREEGGVVSGFGTERCRGSRYRCADGRFRGIGFW